MTRLLLCIMLFLTSFEIAAEDAAESSPTAASMYFELDPAFVLNYGNGGDGRLKFLRAELTLRLATQGEVINAVNLHMPAIRHAIIMHLSKQTSQRVNDAAQRETLRAELRDQVRATLAEAGVNEGVEDLLFNAFLVQR